MTSTESSQNLPHLDITQLTASASNEWNPWYQWLSQGLTKDESTEPRECPTSSTRSYGVCMQYNGAGGCVSYSYSQTSSSTRMEYICKGGYDNCTEVTC